MARKFRERCVSRLLGRISYFAQVLLCLKTVHAIKTAPSIKRYPQFGRAHEAFTSWAPLPAALEGGFSPPPFAGNLEFGSRSLSGFCSRVQMNALNRREFIVDKSRTVAVRNSTWQSVINAAACVGCNGVRRVHGVRQHNLLTLVRCMIMVLDIAQVDMDLRRLTSTRR